MPCKIGSHLFTDQSSPHKTPMRTILTAILCSSLLIGGSSTAAEADAAEFQSHRQTPGFYVVVQPGKTDINDLVDRLTKAGCRVKYPEFPR